MFKFVAVWLNQSGSVSALCQEHAINPLAMSLGKSSITRSCIHTFSKEMAEKFLGVSSEALEGTDAKASKQIEVDAEAAFGMRLRIQTLEALGQEEAIKLRILTKRQSGEVVGMTTFQKLDRETKEPVRVNGKPVYRKTRLVAADSTNPADADVRVEVPVEAAKPTIATPTAVPGADDEGIEELF